MNYQFNIERENRLFSIEIVLFENDLFLSHDIALLNQGDLAIQDADFVLIKGHQALFQEIKGILMSSKENLLDRNHFSGSLKQWILGSIVDDRFIMVLKNRIMSRLAYDPRFRVKEINIKMQER